MRRLLLVVPLLASSGCATPLTPQRVAPSLAEVFAGLYPAQQRLLGRDTVDGASLQALASCQRTGSDDDGPGEDWQCNVQYVDQGTASVQTFELQVKPDGCWKAQGTPGVQPATLVQPATQVMLANPLAEFDGCLDTSW
ncbi:MAG: hypothetical protein ABR549_17255 [Mycobacteriales bacterium]